MFLYMCFSICVSLNVFLFGAFLHTSPVQEQREVVSTCVCLCACACLCACVSWVSCSWPLCGLGRGERFACVALVVYISTAEHPCVRAEIRHAVPGHLTSGSSLVDGQFVSDATSMPRYIYHVCSCRK